MTDIVPVAWMHDGFVSTNKARVEHDEMRNRSSGFKAKPIHALYSEEVVNAMQAEIENLRAEVEALRARLAEPEQSAWIPCSERDPPALADVLLWCGWAITGKRGIHDTYITEDGANPVHMVTHWMPLPAPPEEKHHGIS